MTATIAQIALPQPLGSEIGVAEVSQALTAARGWPEQMRYLITLGGKLPSLEPALRQPEAKVAGCESEVWLWHVQGEDGRLHFAADSDARIIRGLIAVVLAALNHKSPAQIAAFDMEAWFTELGLLRHLSPSRGNGIRAIVARIRALAESAR